MFEQWIIKENSHWLAIDKPSGLVVERSTYESHTIEDMAQAYLSQQYRNPFVGIVHRLDRLTSGVLLLAKKRSALRHLNQQFQQRSIQKTYLALVEKSLPTANGMLSHTLIKDQKNKKAIVKDRTELVEGQYVELSYRELKHTPEGVLLEVRPKTGRFHQIRAQLAHVGSPILGDEKYGSSKPWKDRSVALHAWKLRFRDPKTNEQEELHSQNHPFG